MFHFKKNNSLKRIDFMNSIDSNKIWSKSMTISEIKALLEYLENELIKYEFVKDKNFIMNERRKCLKKYIEIALSKKCENISELIPKVLSIFLKFVSDDYSGNLISISEEYGLSIQKLYAMDDKYRKKGIISAEEKDVILEIIKLIKDYISNIELSSKIELINGSCIEQKVDAIVNAANRNLWPGGGISGAIFKKAGYHELTDACSKITIPLKDGEAVITPAFNIKNTKYIIHAVGPDFGATPNAFNELYLAYYNSLKILMDNNLHSIAFPLISTGFFGNNLENAVIESAKQCIKAYNNFVKTYQNYEINVKLCAYTKNEMEEAQKIFNKLKVSNDYIKKHDSALFNYYYVEDENNIEIITEDNRKIKEKKNMELDCIQKASLYLQLTGDCDVTAFSAYMNVEFFFYNIIENNNTKTFCFISENIFNKVYSPKFDKELSDRINNDLKDFYSIKELQLKYNFVILHPICFEIKKDNKINYRPLTSLDDNIISQLLNNDYSCSNLNNYI